MKIICIGRNYAEHAKELNSAIPKTPVIFLKPDSAILRQRDAFYLPSFSNDIHYEVEFVFKINRLGRHIQEKFSYKYFSQISVGIDFTARDVQKELKSKGLPWEKAKAFDQSAAVGKWVNKEDFDLKTTIISLTKNDLQVQKGCLADMLFSIDQLIAYTSKYFTLKIGDLFFTGTPKGVGPVKSGDVLKAYLNDILLLRVLVK